MAYASTKSLPKKFKAKKNKMDKDMIAHEYIIIKIKIPEVNSIHLETKCTLFVHSPRIMIPYIESTKNYHPKISLSLLLLSHFEASGLHHQWGTFVVQRNVYMCACMGQNSCVTLYQILI